MAQLDGTFRLELDYALSSNGGAKNASKFSQEEIESLKPSNRGFLEPGKMYAFEYDTDLEPEYDEYPIVIGLGYYNQKNTDNQLGINLHYMPYDVRLPFVELIIKSMQSHIEQELDKSFGDGAAQNPYPQFTWDNVKKAYGTMYNLSYCVRQYRMKQIEKIKVLGYEDWYLGTLNDEDNFSGTNMRMVQNNYYKNI